MVTPLPGLGRRLRRQLAPHIAAAADTPGADRYRKHFPAEAHLWILLAHVLTGSDSLRQTHADLAGGAAGTWAALDLPHGISRSQLARSSTSRPSACAETLFDRVVALARRRVAADPALAPLRRVQVIDSSFVALSAKLSPWSQHGGHAPGIRLQTGLDLAGAIPADLRLTLADTNDVTALDRRDLADLAGWTVVFDLGYYAHRLFAELRAATVSFITRLHPQAAYTVETAQPVDPTPTAAGDVVLADATITQGRPNNRRGAVLPEVRLVVSRNPAGEEQRFVTDRADLTAAEVVTLYRQRWQIELFFRWLKHQLKAIHPFGTSREAVWLTLLITATVAAIVTLVDALRPPGDSRVAWLRGLGRALLIAPHPTPPTAPDTS
jgi:hypothetical protein